MILYVLILMNAAGSMAVVDNINSLDSCKKLGDALTQVTATAPAPQRMTYVCAATVKLQPI